jgi:hypothetical protein
VIIKHQLYLEGKGRRVARQKSKLSTFRGRCLTAVPATCYNVSATRRGAQHQLGGEECTPARRRGARCKLTQRGGTGEAPDTFVSNLISMHILSCGEL